MEEGKFMVEFILLHPFDILKGMKMKTAADFLPLAVYFWEGCTFGWQE